MDLACTMPTYLTHQAAKHHIGHSAPAVYSNCIHLLLVPDCLPFLALAIINVGRKCSLGVTGGTHIISIGLADYEAR
jgi:hypothetical protein